MHRIFIIKKFSNHLIFIIFVYLNHFEKYNVNHYFANYSKNFLFVHHLNLLLKLTSNNQLICFFSIILYLIQYY